MPTDPETAPLLPHPEDALDLLPGMLDGDNLRCEPDEYAALVDELRKDGVVGAHRWRGGRAGAGALGAVLPCLGRVVKDSFTGKDLVDWCVDKKMMTRERGVFMGKQLVSRRFGVNVASETEFRVSGERQGGKEREREICLIGDVCLARTTSTRCTSWPPATTPGRSTPARSRSACR